MPSQRLCVVKQLKPIHNNPQIYQLVKDRFQREAAILETLGGNCDQIPALYAYGVAELGYDRGKVRSLTRTIIPIIWIRSWHICKFEIVN